MREMRTGSLSTRGRTPLAVKGSLPRAFLSLGVFVEIGLMFFGSYLLTQAMLQPLQASAAAVVSGGLFLSLGSVLLFYLLFPAKTKSILHEVDNLEEEGQGTIIEVSAKAIPEERRTGWLPGRTEDPSRAMEAVRIHAAGKAGR